MSKVQTWVARAEAEVWVLPFTERVVVMHEDFSVVGTIHRDGGKYVVLNTAGGTFEICEELDQAVRALLLVNSRPVLWVPLEMEQTE